MKLSHLGLTIATTTAIALSSLTTPASALVATPSTGDWGWPVCTLELTPAEVDFYQDSLQLAQDTLVSEFKKILPTAADDIDLLHSFLDDVDTDNNIVFLTSWDSVEGTEHEADWIHFKAISDRILAASRDAGLDAIDTTGGEPAGQAFGVIGMLVFLSSFESFDGYFTRSEVSTNGATLELGSPHFQNGIDLISGVADLYEGPSALPAETAIAKSFQTLLPLQAAVAPALQSCVDGVGGTFTPVLSDPTPGPDENGATIPPAVRTGGSSFGSS